MHLKKYLTSIVIAAFLGVLFMKSFQPSEKTVSETLIVGLQSGYPPFEFMDREGNIVGFDVDLAHLIAERMGKSLLLKDMEFDGEILSLKQGKIDLIISGMNITPSRQKEIHQVPYHGEKATSLSLIFWGEIPKGVHHLKDLSKLSNPIVSVESGSISEVYLTHYPEIPIRSFQGALAPLLDVKFGKSAANLVEPDVAKYLQKEHPEIKILSIPLDSDEMVLGFGIGVKKENLELIQEIEKIISQLNSSGILPQLEEKWFKGGAK